MVSKIDKVSGPGFYALAKELNLLPKPGKAEQEMFWIGEVQQAYAHYGATNEQAKASLFYSIEVFYNRQRKGEDQ